MSSSNTFVDMVSGVALGIIGLATVAVVLSNKSNTTNVVKSATTGFANLIKAAVAPVTSSAI